MRSLVFDRRLGQAEERRAEIEFTRRDEVCSKIGGPIVADGKRRLLQLLRFSPIRFFELVVADFGAVTSGFAAPRGRYATLSSPRRFQHDLL
jgi:hypothetical protein